MDFSFLICSINSNKEYHKTIIESIESQNIPNYEIISIGCEIPGARFIEFDETIRNGWITKKKNILAKEAKYDNLVLMHDYIMLNHNWYENYKYFEDFNVCMNPIFNYDYSRFRDWCLWALDVDKYLYNREFLLPYQEKSLSKLMYISGAYFLVKKQFILDNPLNEDLLWGESEDVEWSKRVREITEFKINTQSSVRLLKQKWMDFNFMNDERLKLFKYQIGV